MRMPYYLAQYHQQRPAGPQPKVHVLPVLVATAIVLAYVGGLATLLLGVWS